MYCFINICTYSFSIHYVFEENLAIVGPSQGLLCSIQYCKIDDADTQGHTDQKCLSWTSLLMAHM